jgi:predicted PurR-regulated permease PerM
METDRRMFALTLIAIFTIVTIVGYVSIANAQNITAGGNMTSNATTGISQNDTSIGTAKELENLTGNNTQQFNNSALANLTTGISEKVSNLTGNLVGNQSGNQSQVT